MTSYMFFKKRNHTLRIRVFALIIGLISTGCAFVVYAADEVTGWMWGGTPSSDGAYQGMKWISVSGPVVSGGVYGLTIPTTDGPLSGYVWSSDYGWISFNGVDLAGCDDPIPFSLTQAKRVGNKIEGGARILAIRDAKIADNAGGFDGCISLSGSTTSSGESYGLEIKPADGKFTDKSYAWSSDLGWIDFSKVIASASNCGPTTIDHCNLSSTPYGATVGGNCGTGYIGTCTYTCGLYGAGNTLGFGNGNNTCALPPPQCSDGTDNDNDGKTDYNGGVNGDLDCTSDTDTTEAGPTTFSVKPPIQKMGGEVTITYDTQGRTCAIKRGYAPAWDGSNVISGNGTQNVNVYANTTFELKCPLEADNKTASVEVIPVGREY